MSMAYDPHLWTDACGISCQRSGTVVSLLFVPGEPYIFFIDPDGYEVEIWFEIPTPVDPKE